MYNPYVIEKTGERRFARAAAVEMTYKVRFNDQWRGERIREHREEMHRMFDEVVNRGREGLNDNDFIRVIIKDNELNSPIVVPLQPADEMNAENIMQKVENVLQSKEDLAVDNSFEGK